MFLGMDPLQFAVTMIVMVILIGAFLCVMGRIK